MRNLIAIDDKKDYTLSEFAHIVRRALSAIANESPDCEFVYSGREVYFTVFDLLGYVNDRVPGEFKIEQPKSKHYEIVYTEKEPARQVASNALAQETARTAQMLFEQTGEWPEGVKNVKGKS